MSRASYRREVLEAKDQVGATLYVGDALHRLAKAFEMLLDPEDVERRRYRDPETDEDGPRRSDLREAA